MPPPALRTWFFVACLFATVGLGLAKTWRQSQAPPAWAQRGHLYHGFVAIDGHADRAELMRDWLRGDEGAAERLRENVFDPLRHQTSLLVQFLVALASLAVGSIPLAFLLVSGLALLATTWLVARLAFVLAPEPVAGASAQVAAIAFLAHELTVRVTMQLHLDAFVACGAVLAALLTRRWLVEGRSGSALFVVHVLGVFCKSSFWPMLAVPALAALVMRKGQRLRCAAVAALCFGALPLLVGVGYMALGPGLGATTSDVRTFSAVSGVAPGQRLGFALEMILLCQWLPLLYIARKVTLRGAQPVWVALLVVLAVILVLHLPVVPRLYWPMVALGATLAGPALVAGTSPRAAGRLVLGFVLANYAFATAAVFLA